MNQEVFEYKKRFLTMTLLFSYAYLHIHLTAFFAETTLKKCLEFNTPLPFAQRLLMPMLAHGLHIVCKLPIFYSFFLCEWLFTVLLYLSLKRLLRTEFDKKHAELLTWLFFLLLPLVYVVNYRASNQYGFMAALYYPWDTPTLFFMATGFLWCIQQKWSALIVWIALATLNRESSILLCFIIPLLHWPDKTRIVKPFCYALGAYGLTRLIILWWLNKTFGHIVELHAYQSFVPLFVVNLDWLFNKQNIFFYLFCFAGLPWAWFVFYDYIPYRYRLLRFLLLIYFISLLFVGLYHETRIYGELIILLYLPVAVAIKNWLQNTPITICESPTFAHYSERYIVIFLLILSMMSGFALSLLTMNG